MLPLTVQWMFRPKALQSLCIQVWLQTSIVLQVCISARLNAASNELGVSPWHFF